MVTRPGVCPALSLWSLEGRGRKRTLDPKPAEKHQSRKAQKQSPASPFRARGSCIRMPRGPCWSPGGQSGWLSSLGPVEGPHTPLSPCVSSSRDVPGLGPRRKHQQGSPQHAGTCREPHHLPWLHHPCKCLGRRGRGLVGPVGSTSRRGLDRGQSSGPAPLSPLCRYTAPASVGGVMS